MAAGLYAASFPKISQCFLLAFFFMIPLLQLVAQQKPRYAFLSFFGFSWISYVFLLYWIPRVMVKYGGTTYFLGVIGLIALASLLALFHGLVGLIVPGLLSRPLLAITLLPVLWVSKDLLIEKFWSGFPWCLAGYTQTTNFYFFQVAEWGGIHLVTHLVLTINVLLFFALRRRRLRFLTAALVIFVLVGGSGYLLQKKCVRTLSALPRQHAGILQSNSSYDQPFDYLFIKNKIDYLLKKSAALHSQGAEWLVWPEFTVPIYPRQSQVQLALFQRFAREQAPVLAGFTDLRNDNEVYNSIMLFDGKQVAQYDKVHLTPFGEYIPLRRLLFFVKKITDEIGDFTPGPGVRNIPWQGHLLGVPICYEVIFPELVATFVRRGAQVLVNVSNDSWYGNSSAPYQSLMMARCRAIENRRYLLRATSNGISAVIDPLGRVVRQSPLQREDYFVAPFVYLGQLTFFVRAGYLFPYCCAALAFIYLLFLTCQRSRSKKKSPLEPTK